MARLKVWDETNGVWRYAGGVDPAALAQDPTFIAALLALTIDGGNPSSTPTMTIDGGVP